MHCCVTHVFCCVSSQRRKGNLFKIGHWDSDRTRRRVASQAQVATSRFPFSATASRGGIAIDDISGGGAFACHRLFSASPPGLGANIRKPSGLERKAPLSGLSKRGVRSKHPKLGCQKIAGGKPAPPPEPRHTTPPAPRMGCQTSIYPPIPVFCHRLTGWDRI